MKRLLIACAVLLASVLPVSAQTVMPNPLIQWFDNNGDPLSAGGLCVFSAGTSTLATTYTTSALSVANANPILFNLAGRPTTGGVFLIDGVSYKFVLVDFTGVVTPSCSAINGVTIWTVDNVLAVPGSAANVVVTGTAGESITAGDAVYLSAGDGGRTQGTWYRTDADFTYASSEAYLVGVAEAAINSGVSGSITIAGRVDVAGPLSSGNRYWATASAGGYATSVPANARKIGTALSTTALEVNPDVTQLASLASPYVYNAVQAASTNQFRCSLTTGVAVTTADVTAATTVYWTPYNGTTVGLYTGSVWLLATSAQLSIAVPATTATMYDLFVDYNDGTPQLAVTAWTNDTTRATALTTQNGVLVKTGDTQQRYACSFRTTGVSGQTEDSFAKRFLWNNDNRVPRLLRAPLETANTWNYSTNTWRQANANTANKYEFVVGVAEVALETAVIAAASNNGVGMAVAVAVGLDSITVPTANQLGRGSQTVTGAFFQITASLRAYPAVGYHYAAWLEWGDGGGGTATWVGDFNTPSEAQMGISGEILG